MSKMTKIDIIARPEKLEELKGALNAIGVQGMTVSQVFGCGLQKGHTEVYRGQEYSVNLLPMIKLETVVCEVLVEDVLETARQTLQTGRVGDGKIFVYTIDDCMRIRTGTRGSRAIIDDEVVDE
ncbi:nitrogen regulatory protein P-II [Megasphaera vaginalis (ex Srinivasan et al. 2021)]|uniref:Nitrogen regulatory protein P-II n=2 Tax=Megasphaera vaginalis (ex Srinivasan et al. 2021) TaxID=1111454 RepID=U7USR8_9FIRM|nr:P-II family nitrogen regulator [Megasphaera vaginalis (ex Srinivasan et al. 2021)]ERT62487.1 nitrogen regulatory protein P-II [Megasphaera vaginalis (ex Srinivasan et al. 2021)]